MYATPAVIWPPDDTEESVLGTNLHQGTITNVRLGFNELASTLAQPGQPPPWHALSQTTIRGLRRPDGSRYRVLPDVFIYRQHIDERRASLSLAADGPPLLIVEVASESTYQKDLDLVFGKGYSYAQAGVREYLVIDPTGEFVPEGIRAWRLHDAVYRPWLPETTGRWHSQEIAAAIVLEGIHVAVYTQDGRRMIREGEAAQALARKDKELADLRQQLEQLLHDRER
ncbi:MAG TPA: Uma2 family endonuclease [Chloroflexota bacterium]|nr:Uma2 family endonuclease [Chloroflexota bacterium]